MILLLVLLKVPCVSTRASIMLFSFQCLLTPFSHFQLVRTQVNRSDAFHRLVVILLPFWCNRQCCFRSDSWSICRSIVPSKHAHDWSLDAFVPFLYILGKMPSGPFVCVYGLTFSGVTTRASVSQSVSTKTISSIYLYFVFVVYFVWSLNYFLGYYHE